MTFKAKHRQRVAVAKNAELSSFRLHELRTDKGAALK
jgi:hypothetical protein